MFGPGRDHLCFLERLRSVVGEYRELNDRTTPGDWWFAAKHRGRDVRVAITGSRGTFTGVRYAAPLAVPARIHVEGHYATYSHTPVVQTGDPEFDRRYKVHGVPPEVIARVLGDERVRSWYREVYGDRSPQTDTEGSWVSLYRGYRIGRLDTFDLSPEEVPSAAEIAHFLDVVVDLTDRIGHGFHENVAAIAAAHGPAAGEAWAAQQAGTILAAREASRHRRLLILGVVVGLFVILPVAVICLVGAFAVLGGP